MEQESREFLYLIARASPTHLAAGVFIEPPELSMLMQEGEAVAGTAQNRRCVAPKSKDAGAPRALAYGGVKGQR